MASGDRTYLPKIYPLNPEREPVFQDLGNLLNISGIVLQGMGATIMIMLPTANPVGGEVMSAQPDLNEWARIIAQTDDPEEFIGEVGGLRKVLQRKSRAVISGMTQQKIWARDGIQCVYCKQKMDGIRVGLTVDHFDPLELGGVNDESNYLSACRKCNKAKGNMSAAAWCALRGYDEQAFRDYLASVT